MVSLPLMTLTVILNGLYVFHPSSDFIAVILNGFYASHDWL